MADWTDISDLWWLQPKRESGRALQGLALGAQIAQNRTENEWRQQQAQVLMDQRRAAMQTQEAKVRGIAAMSSYMADVAARNAWTDPAAKAGFYRLGAQYPQAIDDPTLQAMARNFEMAEARDAQAKQHAQTTAITELTTADRWEQIADQMESLGPLDEEMSKQVSNLRQRAVLLRGRQLAPTETIETLPEGGFRITRGPSGAAAGGLTQPVITDLQKRSLASQDMINRGIGLLDRINANTVGPAAAAANLIVDRGLANIFPGMANMERVSVRQTMRLFNEQLRKSLKVDSQINVKEEARYDEAILKLGLLDAESPVAARGKLAATLKEAMDIERVAAQRLKRPIPDYSMTADELVAEHAKWIRTNGKEGISEERIRQIGTQRAQIEAAIQGGGGIQLPTGPGLIP